MSDTVTAIWNAGYPVVLPDGRELHKGDEHEVPADEAAASDNWLVPKPAKGKADS
jgi:hypothetical protein